MSEDHVPPAAGGRPRAPSPCPVCGRPSRRESRPFCSERCRQVDLGRWLSGGYAIPGDSLRDAPDED